MVVCWFDAADGSVVAGTPLLTSLRFIGMVPVGVKFPSIFIILFLFRLIAAVVYSTMVTLLVGQLHCRDLEFDCPGS